MHVLNSFFGKQVIVQYIINFKCKFLKKSNSFWKYIKHDKVPMTNITFSKYRILKFLAIVKQ